MGKVLTVCLLLAAVCLIPLGTLAQTPSSGSSATDAQAARIAKLEQAVADAKSSGDNAWMLMCSALVLMMTGPGLALFYGGLVRKKNVLATMMQSFAMMA
ncbi:MAG: ammonium transporter, partial [Acidobacteriales bacterium]|nr:ammonium transporter [Terriglobales bacterium]